LDLGRKGGGKKGYLPTACCKKLGSLLSSGRKEAEDNLQKKDKTTLYASLRLREGGSYSHPPTLRKEKRGV